MVKGIGTKSFVIKVFDAVDEAKETAGLKRYSARVNWPSGGMKENDLSRAHLWSLNGGLARKNYEGMGKRHTVHRDEKSSRSTPVGS